MKLLEGIADEPGQLFIRPERSVAFGASDDEDVRFVQTGTESVVTQVEIACPVDNLPPTG